jgi:hypothetical protein
MHRFALCLAAVLFVVPPLFAENAGKVLLTTSDYASGNTASYDIATGTFADNLLGHYQDAYVRTYGDRVFVIESGDNSSIIRLDAAHPGTPVWQYSVGAGSNPHDLVFVPSAGKLKGYVIRYGKPSIWVVDLDAAKSGDFKLGEIDISQWNDSDGSPDAHMGFYCGGFVWVVLQKYDLSSFTSGTAVLLKIDPRTDTVVDMDPSATGVQGVDLAGRNPVAGSLSGSVLFLACTTYGVSEGGVWSVDLNDPAHSQRSVVSESALGSFVGGVYLSSPDYAVVSTYNASWELVPRPMDFTTGRFLPALPVPDDGGGVVFADGVLYIGSRNRENPGLYVCRPGDLSAVHFFPTSLPPLTIAYAGEGTTRVNDMPSAFTVGAPYPNPFNASVTIPVTLAEDSEIVVTVYSVTGQTIAKLASGRFEAGEHLFTWRPEGMSSGVFFVRVSAGAATKALRIVYLK